MVSVDWTRELMPPSDVRDNLVRGIASQVSGLLAQKRRCWQTDWAKPDDRILGQYIEEIWIDPEHGNSHWNCGDAGVASDAVQRVQAIINGKESRTAKYRGVCKIVWLLIVAEGRISSWFAPHEEFDHAIFPSSFDRVFAFDVFRNQVRELTIRPI